MRFSLRHLLFAVAIAAGVAWSISLGISRTSHNIEANRTTYAARLVAHMCVAHMKANGHTWPRDWGDLRDDFATCLAQSYVPQVASGISVGFHEPGNQSGRRSDAAQ